MSRLLLLLLLILVTAPATAQRAAQMDEGVREFVAEDARQVVLQGVKVIDGTGAPAVENATIVITDGVITQVATEGEPVEADADASVHNLSGHTVIPGMVGLHNHTFYMTSERSIQLNFSAPVLYLASGVTTIRTTGSRAPYSELNLKESINRGQSIGPRMFVTGPYITGGEGMSTMTQVDSPEDARRVVRYWAEEGVDWFKAYTLISKPALAAAIDEAHKVGVKVTGHLCSVSFKEAVEIGIDNLEHGYFTNTDYEEGKAESECPSGFRNTLAQMETDDPRIQDTFRAMIDAGVPMTSTLAVYEMYVPNRPPLERRVLEAMSPDVRTEYLESRAEVADEGNGGWTTLFAKAQAFEKAFVEAGGLLGAGVDPTGYGGALPGYGDQRNYELLIEAGFSPIEAVQIMTLNGARILGIDGETGSIEEGKTADLVVIEGDPEARPAEIRGVRLVFRSGIGYDSPALIEAVRGKVGVQ